MLVALAVAAAISATAGTLSMLAGGVVDGSDAPTFWRTWWLGDLAGALVVVAARWRGARHPRGVAPPAHAGGRADGRRRRRCSACSPSSIEEPVTYVVFPALIWAAFRFGAAGRDAGDRRSPALLAIGITAAEVGPFFKQPIDHRTLGTQLYSPSPPSRP